MAIDRTLNTVHDVTVYQRKLCGISSAEQYFKYMYFKYVFKIHIFKILTLYFVSVFEIY